MKISTEPRSDQWNADDFIGGPKTFTIAGVKTGAAEQKYDIELVEGEGRVWRPSVTSLRLLVSGWTDDSAVWTGRRVTLFRDPTITFGRDKVGGIRISHMSDLPNGKPLAEMLTVTRGKRAVHSVQPLPDLSPIDRLKAEWRTADPDRRKAIESEVAALAAATQPDVDPAQDALIPGEPA